MMKRKMNMCLFFFYFVLYFVLCTYVLGISNELLKERTQSLNDNNNDSYNNNNINDQLSFANKVVRFTENEKDDKEDKTMKIISRPVENTLNRNTDSSFLNIKKYGRKAEYLNRSSFVQRAYISDCQAKRKKHTWICENEGNNNICIPDRRVQLCIAALKDIKNSGSEKMDIGLLTDKIFESAMYETDLLWKKYGFRGYYDFCDDVKNSFLDYKDVLFGKDLDKNNISKLVEKSLKSFFKEDSTVLTPDAWWGNYGAKLWRSMIKPYRDFGCKRPDDTEPQINRWLREWGKYNCKLLKEHQESLENQCSVNKKKTDCSSKCNSECYAYRNLINRQKYEITRLAKSYVQVIRYNVFNQKIVQPNNAYDFIKAQCSDCKDIDFKALFENEYGKYEEKCMCQSYLDLKIQFKDRDVCSFNADKDTVSSDKRFCLDKKEFKPWQCDKNNFEKVHNEGVCVSPRRQGFCLGNLSYLLSDDIYNIHNRQLLIEIIMASQQEGKLLWKKHGTILENDNACKYINDSYNDYRDIVIGNDLWNDKNSVKVQQNLNMIFERNFGYKVGKERHFKSIKELKYVWWILNRDKIWDSMKCGIKEADPRRNSCKKMDELENMPQFYRWFSQWAHYFCKEKKYWESKLNDNCKDIKGNSLCNETTCQNVCSRMNYWTYSRKIAYKIQSAKYDKDKTSFDLAKDKDVSTFLKENTNNCSNIDFTKIFDELDKLFKERCPCMDTKTLETKNEEMLALEKISEEETDINEENEEEEESQEYELLESRANGNKGTKSVPNEMEKNKEREQPEKEEATQTSGSLEVGDNKGSDSIKGESTNTNIEKPSEKLEEVPKDASKGETIKDGKQTLTQSPENSSEQAQVQGEQEKTSAESERSESDQPQTGGEASKLKNETSLDQERKESSSSAEEGSSKTPSENTSSQDREESSIGQTDKQVVDKETVSTNLENGEVHKEQMSDPNISTEKNVSLEGDKEKEVESNVSITDSNEQKDQSTQSTHTPVVEGEKEENSISPVTENSESESGLNSTNGIETTTIDVKEQQTIKEDERVSETSESSSEISSVVDASHEKTKTVPSGTSIEEEKEILKSKHLDTTSGPDLGSNDQQDVTDNSAEVNRNDDNNLPNSIDNPSDDINREVTTSETEDVSEPKGSNKETSTEVPSITVTTSDGKSSVEEERKTKKEPVSQSEILESIQNSVNEHTPDNEQKDEREALRPEEYKLYSDTLSEDISERDLNDIKSLKANMDNISLGDSSENRESAEGTESRHRELRQHDFRGEGNFESDAGQVQDSILENEEFKKLLNKEYEENDNEEMIHRTTYDMKDRVNNHFDDNNLSSEEKMNQYKNRNVSEAREEILKMSKTNTCSNNDSLKYCDYMERNKDLLETCSLENRLHLCCAISDYCLKFFNPNSVEYFNCTQNEFDDPTYNCFRKQRFTSMHYIAGGGIIALLLFILGSASYKKNLNDEEGFYDSNLNDSAFEYNNNKYNKLPYMFDQQINVGNSDLYSEGIYDDTTTF
ncbi:erythrocyte binding antigen-181 [Plasmodium sp. gorilla clade G2]|uniref:erythrocyte binding antigen-181 n=1 Tax=Plasmodium sp. gorilla clade G2 TaxID=880535 RepID=UPI000D26ADA4|nr:erythrocyte binding antigen-181 [Plasmodium sp. gorilla clade G2]SOV20221.1 erythrocyte binding antigen-181 [Plasmodium sp. gorilla clade G2]